MKATDILFALLVLALQASAFINQTCANSTVCKADAPLCVNKTCQPCQQNFDCFNLGMY